MCGNFMCWVGSLIVDWLISAGQLDMFCAKNWWMSFAMLSPTAMMFWNHPMHLVRLRNKHGVIPTLSWSTSGSLCSLVFMFCVFFTSPRHNVSEIFTMFAWIDQKLFGIPQALTNSLRTTNVFPWGAHQQKRNFGTHLQVQELNSSMHVAKIEPRTMMSIEVWLRHERSSGQHCFQCCCFCDC